MIDAVVDNMPLPPERVAWSQAAQDFSKPVFNRSEQEMSRILTLISRLSFFKQLPFDVRLLLSKQVKFVKVTTGDPVLSLDSTGRVFCHVGMGTWTGFARGGGAGMRTTVTAPDGSRASSASNRNSSNTAPAAAAAGSGADTSATVNSNTAAYNSNSSSAGNTPVTSALVSGGGSAGGSLANATLASASQRGHSDLYIIVFGSIGMRLDTVTGRTQSELFKGDTFGAPLQTNALPPNTSFIAIDNAELLCIPHSVYVEQLAHLDELEIERRTSYFQSLLIPIFVAWPPRQLEELARNVFPIKYQSKEVIVKEGDPADSVCFITSGKMKVIREIDFTQNVGAPSVKLLELATLGVGEYFGELALLRFNVDVNRRVKLSKLANMALTMDDEDLLEEEADRQNEVRKIDSEIGAHPRQATVYAHTPSEVLLLSRGKFIELITDSALVRLREYARGYPSHSEIRAHFLRHQKWESFKGQVVGQVSFGGAVGTMPTAPTTATTANSGSSNSNGGGGSSSTVPPSGSAPGRSPRAQQQQQTNKSSFKKLPSLTSPRTTTTTRR